MPHIRAHVDLPTLEALEGEWRMHPPVHHLVAAFVSYDASAEHPGGHEPVDHEDDDGAGLAALLGACKPIDAGAALQHAGTEAERINALERLFFGEVKDVSQL